MTLRRVGSDNGAKAGTGRQWLGCVVAAVLALSGCSSGSTTPSAIPSDGSPPATPTSSPGGTDASGFPESVFTDAELEAIINGVAQNRNLQFPTAQDSERVRSGASSGSFPEVNSETTPSECIAFVPENPFVRWADRSMNFGEGVMPIGAESGPTTSIMITLRSAEKAAVAKADFDYTEDLRSRCAQFDLAYTEAGRTSTSAYQLLDTPPIAEKQHGLMVNRKPKGPADYGSVGLRVLAGTMSITLSLAVAGLESEADAQPALDSMAGLTRELIDQAVKKPPTVAPQPPNSRTADDLVGLFKGVTGPDGSPVTLPKASVIGPPPGVSAAPSSQPVPPCTFNENAYYGSLAGAVLGQGQIPGATKMEYIDFAVISMPTTAAPPYPFDTRASALSSCDSIQEDMMGSSRPWSGVSHLSTTMPSDASYAIAYQLSDGTGGWHVRAGARRGSLSVEASSQAPSQAEAQGTADGLAAFFGRVFSNAGL